MYSQFTCLWVQHDITSLLMCKTLELDFVWEGSLRGYPPIQKVWEGSLPYKRKGSHVGYPPTWVAYVEATHVGG